MKRALSRIGLLLVSMSSTADYLDHGGFDSDEGQVDGSASIPADFFVYSVREHGRYAKHDYISDRNRRVSIRATLARSEVRLDLLQMYQVETRTSVTQPQLDDMS
jgi:hypothetical protein